MVRNEIEVRLHDGTEGYHTAHATEASEIGTEVYHTETGKNVTTLVQKAPELHKSRGVSQPDPKRVNWSPHHPNTTFKLGVVVNDNNDLDKRDDPSLATSTNTNKTTPENTIAWQSTINIVRRIEERRHLWNG